MSHTIGRRILALAAVTAAAVGGVALAQNYGGGPSMPGSAATSATPLRVRVTLSDGQSVDLNCVHVAIDFQNGGHLHVTGKRSVSPYLARAVA